MSRSVNATWIKWAKLNWIDLTVLAGVYLVLLISGLKIVGDFRIDDAYITFAYSKNLANGHGPIYGYDLKVEGYSNFLWMVLAAIGEVIGVGALKFARALSHLSFVGILGATYAGARALGGRFAALLAVIVLAASTDMVRLIQSGLETVLYCACIAGGLAHYLLEKKNARRWSLLWFAAAGLTRIDGFVPLALIIGLELVRAICAVQRPTLKSLSIWVGIGVAPVLIFWIWRVSYYGLLFPLPYYAKASLGMLEFDRGVDYVQNGLRETGLWVAVLFATFGLRLKDKRPSLVIALFIFVLAAYAAYVGGDWMPFNRMLVPMAAPLLMLASQGMGRLLAQLQARSVPIKVLGLGLCLGTTAFMVQHQNQYTIDTPLEGSKVGHNNHLLKHTAGLLEALPFIQAMVRAPGERLVTDYGGVYAYGTDASVIEMWGLANREIALRGNTDGIAAIYGKTCVPCYAEFNPDYFHSVTPLIRGDNAFSSSSALIRQIFQGAAIDRVIGLRKNYVMGRVRRPKSGQTLWFLERKREGVTFESRNVGEFVVDYPQANRHR